MTIKDGFKFGIGLFLAQLTVVLVITTVYLVGLASIGAVAQAYLNN